MPGLSRSTFSAFPRLLRPIANAERRLRDFWQHTSPRRRFTRVTGIVLFACMTIITMGDQGCGGCHTDDTIAGPAPVIFTNFILGGAGIHYHTQLRPQFTGTDNSQTGIASFVGNVTAITQPASTYFAMLRMADCSLSLVTATSPLDGTFTVSSTANTNYEQTLHQLAGLKTAPDVFPNGCHEGTTDLSARVGVFAGVTKSNIAVLATAESNGANNAVFVLTSNSDQSTVNFRAISGTNSATALVTADLDGDGSGDLVAVNSYNATSSYVTVILGNADGSFKPPVTYATAGNYSATATLDDIDGDGKLDIVSVSADQQISILTGKGDGTFNSAQSFAAPALPGSSLPAPSTPITNIITADVNGDGKRDLICSNGLVLLGDGHGNFTAVASAAFPYTQGSTAAGPFIAAGDLNNDGIVDLAVNDGSSISTWRGKGDGTFTRGGKYAAINNTGYITLSDLDGDGNLDIYTGLADGGIYTGDNSNFASSYVLMGFGNGSFQGASNLPSGAYNGTNLADVTGDGIPDLVTYGPDPRTPSVIGFNLEVGNTATSGFGISNTFSQSANFTVPGFGGNYTVIGAQNTIPSSYAIADVSGDSRADIVFVDNNLPAMSPTGSAVTLPFPVYSVMLYQGLFSFLPPTEVSFPQIAPASGFDNSLTATYLQIADFNKDGKADLLFTYDETAGGPGTVPYNRGFAVLLGNGNGTFSSTPVLTSTYSSSSAPTTALLPQVVSTTDLNGDGIPDLIVINPTFSIITGASTQLLTYIGNGDGTFKPPTTYGLSANVYGIPVLADFDKDGKLDLAFLAETSSSQAELAIAKGNGDGSFAAPTLLNLTGGDSIRSASLAAADFDADGKIDLALLEPNAFSGIFYGKGDGTFTSVPATNYVVPKDLINLSAQGPAAIVSLSPFRPDLLVGSTVLLNTYGTQLATTTTLSPAPTSVPFGTTVNFTAHIAPAAAGLVVFKDGNTTLGTATATLGLSNFPISTLTAGVHNITAYYLGSSFYAGSISSPVSITVAGGSTTTTTALTASATTITAGNPVTITATITPGSSGTPSGTVTFTEGLNTLGTASVSSNQATYTTSTLAAGTHNITATYSGDTTFAGSAASALTITVNPLLLVTTTTTLTASANPVAVGSSTTLTATITPNGAGTPTGTVTFMDGATTLGTTGSVSSNKAIYTTSNLTTGAHNITAVYSGDTNFHASTSTALVVTVTPITTTTTLTASAATITVGTSITFTAAITSGSFTATGSVTFMDGATTLGTGAVSSSNKATYTASALSIGTHNITAVYSGDTNFAVSTSTVLPITVNAVPIITTTTALTSTATQAVSGTSLTFTATVTPASGITVPTGSIVFTDSATTLGTIALDGTGKATYTTNTLSVGSHTIVAAYGGATTFSTSSSVNLPITITASVTPDFAPTLSASTATVTHGNSATTIITVTALSNFNSATTLTCTGAPTNSLCIIAPNSVTPSSAAPATATLTLQTSIQSAALTIPSHTPFLAVISLAATLPLGLISLFATRRRNHAWTLTLLAFAATTTLLFATGCSGGGGSQNANTTQTLTTAPGTYPLTITATSGALTHSATFTVTVQ